MSSTIQADIEQQLARVEPEVEVLLAEVVNGATVRLFIDHPDGVTLALCERVTKHLAGVRETLRARGLLAGPAAPAHQARPLPPLRRPPRPRAHARRARRPHVVHRGAARRDRRRGHRRRRHRRRLDRRTPTSTVPTCWETEDHVARDRRSRTGPRAREGHLRGEADGGARGRAAVRLQEAARRRQVRPRDDGPRVRPTSASTS